MTFMRTAGMLAEHAASKPQRRMLAKGLLGAVMKVPTSFRKNRLIVPDCAPPPRAQVGE